MAVREMEWLTSVGLKGSIVRFMTWVLCGVASDPFLEVGSNRSFVEVHALKQSLVNPPSMYITQTLRTCNELVKERKQIDALPSQPRRIWQYVML